MHRHLPIFADRTTQTGLAQQPPVSVRVQKRMPQTSRVCGVEARAGVVCGLRHRFYGAARSGGESSRGWQICGMRYLEPAPVGLIPTTSTFLHRR